MCVFRQNIERNKRELNTDPRWALYWTFYPRGYYFWKNINSLKKKKKEKIGLSAEDRKYFYLTPAGRARPGKEIGIIIVAGGIVCGRRDQEGVGGRGES